MNILICDDNCIFSSSFAVQLRSLLKQEHEKATITCVQSGIEALQYIETNAPTVLFLDIDMPEMDGFSVARQLCTRAERPIIIFLSSQEHLVFESFGFQPFWFLRKAHLEDLPQVIKRILSNLAAKRLDYTVTVNRNKVHILLSDISYFEANGHYVILHTQKQLHRVKARLSEIENDLKHTYFIRCHTGFLVNSQFVKVAGKAELLLTDGTIIPVSRGRSEKTQNMFMSYMRSLRL